MRIQEMDFKGKNFKLSIQDMYCHKQKIFLLEKKGGLFLYDTLEQSFVFLGQIMANNDVNYVKIHVLDKTTLLFVPYEYGNIIKYDIEKKDFGVFYVPDFQDDIKCMPWKKMIRNRNSLYFLGLDSNIGILSIDVLTGKACVESGWKEEFYKEFGYETSLYFNFDVCKVNNYFWVTLNRKNMIMQYDMETKKSFFYKVGDEEMFYATICYDGHFFWLSGDKPLIVRWNPNTNESVGFNNFPVGFMKKKMTYKVKNDINTFFFNSLKWYDKIYFSPLQANMIVAFDLDKEEIIEIKKMDESIRWFPLQKLDEKHLYYQEQGSSFQCLHEYTISYCNKIEDGILNGKKIYCDKNALLNSRKIIESYPTLLLDYIAAINVNNNCRYFVKNGEIGEKGLEIYRRSI